MEEKWDEEAKEYKQKYEKHKNAKSVIDFHELCKRHTALKKEFHSNLRAKLERIEKTYGEELKKVDRGLQENLSLDNPVWDIYEKILAEEKKQDSNSETEKEILNKFVEIKESIPKVKKDFIKYVKSKNINGVFKDLTIFVLNDLKEESDEYILLLSKMIKK